MATVTTVTTCDPDAAAAYRVPRDCVLVLERADGEGRFSADEGPFDRYERTVTEAPGPDGSVEVTETVSFRVAAPLWRPLLTWPMRRALAQRRTDVPWWAPPDRFDTHTARTVSLLCIGMIVTGYLGAIIGQTATFASDEFGTSDRAQGFLFAAVRLGTLLTLLMTTLADRHGRRRLLLIARTMATGTRGLTKLILVNKWTSNTPISMKIPTLGR